MRVEINTNNNVYIWNSDSGRDVFTFTENQEVFIKIYPNRKIDEYNQIQAHFEDFYIPLKEVVESDAIYFISSSERIFRESFGFAMFRIYIGDELFSIPIEVLATKLHAEHLSKMLSYLYNKRENIIRVCLSRTKSKSGAQRDKLADPETILNEAELFIQILLDNRFEFKQQIRTRLIPMKIPAWKAELRGEMIDPLDILMNLDSLKPSDGGDGIRLKGRSFSAYGIDVSTLIEDSNIEENIVLLGCLYSIRRVISDLINEINLSFHNRNISSFDKEYVSLGELLLKLTGGSMLIRSEQVITQCETLIKYLEQEFSISFHGEIIPRMTPFVRASKVYRTLFNQIYRWYELGAPNLDGLLFIFKMRSISKIFEFFSLFKLYDYLESKDWILNDVGFEPGSEINIPSKFIFYKEENILTLNYEERVYLLRNDTNHNQLVRLEHSKYSGKHWCPDFILEVKNKTTNNVNYLILDAKYSTAFSVEQYHLKNIYDKYYEHMAVYDQNKNLLSRNGIVAVVAIFPNHNKPVLYNSNWLKHSIVGKSAILLPIVTGIPVSIDGEQSLDIFINKIIDYAL